MREFAGLTRSTPCPAHCLAAIPYSAAVTASFPAVNRFYNRRQYAGQVRKTHHSSLHIPASATRSQNDPCSPNNQGTSQTDPSLTVHADLFCPMASSVLAAESNSTHPTAADAASAATAAEAAAPASISVVTAAPNWHSDKNTPQLSTITANHASLAIEPPPPHTPGTPTSYPVAVDSLGAQDFLPAAKCPQPNDTGGIKTSRPETIFPGKSSLQPTQTLYPSPFYSEYPLERMAKLRKSETSLEECFHTDLTSCLIPIHHGKCMVHTPPPRPSSTLPAQPTQPSLFFLSPAADFCSHLLPDTLVFLGHDASGAPYFAAEVTSEGATELALQFPHAPWQPVRSASARMNVHDASLAATANGLVHWSTNTQFSPQTGTPLQRRAGGHSRTDPTSGRSFYPRVDPAVITLVSCGSFCLLGRKPGWPAGRYSTLAGFLEVGETLEQAVAREVAEESAIQVDPSTIRYVTSQPWPFPQSLMVGFHAEALADSSSMINPNSPGTNPNFNPMSLLSPSGRKAAIDTAIPVDIVAETLKPSLQPPSAEEDELEDVKWFHRSYIRAAARGLNQQLVGGFHFPGRHSLAHLLITQWLTAQGMPTWVGDSIPDVRIDTGVFKYVLMGLRDEEGNRKLLVWGDRRASYHMNVFQSCKSACMGMGLQVDVYGGGRIEHYPEQQVINVYGYSMAFGPAPHELTVAILRRWYPFYPEGQITLSYDGY